MNAYLHPSLLQDESQKKDIFNLSMNLVKTSLHTIKINAVLLA